MVDLDSMDPKTVPHPVVGAEEAEWEDMSPEARDRGLAGSHIERLANLPSLACVR